MEPVPHCRELLRHDDGSRPPRCGVDRACGPGARESGTGRRPARSRFTGTFHFHRPGHSFDSTGRASPAIGAIRWHSGGAERGCADLDPTKSRNAFAYRGSRAVKCNGAYRDAVCGRAK